MRRYGRRDDCEFMIYILFLSIGVLFGALVSFLITCCLHIDRINMYREEIKEMEAALKKR